MTGYKDKELTSFGLKIISVSKSQNNEGKEAALITLGYKDKTMVMIGSSKYLKEPPLLSQLAIDLLLFDIDAFDQSYKEWLEQWEFEDTMNEPDTYNRYLESVFNAIKVNQFLTLAERRAVSWLLNP